ncbi:MAG: hypothetical protein HYR84_03255 [Planctomycetes bacterium]|nr:hypothetical protein [Planctomycetota bacterium]
MEPMLGEGESVVVEKARSVAFSLAQPPRNCDVGYEKAPLRRGSDLPGDVGDVTFVDSVSCDFSQMVIGR